MLNAPVVRWTRRAASLAAAGSSALSPDEVSGVWAVRGDSILNITMPGCAAALARGPIRGVPDGPGAERREASRASLEAGIRIRAIPWGGTPKHHAGLRNPDRESAVRKPASFREDPAGLGPALVRWAIRPAKPHWPVSVRGSRAAEEGRPPCETQLRQDNSEPYLAGCREVEQPRRRARVIGTASASGWSPPKVGAVYLADTLVFNNGDHADARPVVVVRPPRRRMDYVTFIQRSSTCFHLAGVDHPAEPSLGLDRDGRWVLAFQRSIREDEFSSYGFEFRGKLDDVYLSRLIDAWEAQP